MTDHDRRAQRARSRRFALASPPTITLPPTLQQLLCGWHTLGAPAADASVWAQLADASAMPADVQRAVEALRQHGSLRTVLQLATNCERVCRDDRTDARIRETAQEWGDRARLIGALLGDYASAVRAAHAAGAAAFAVSDDAERLAYLVAREELHYIASRLDSDMYDGETDWTGERRSKARTDAWDDLLSQAELIEFWKRLDEERPRGAVQDDTGWVAEIESDDPAAGHGYPAVVHAAARQLARTISAVPGLRAALAQGQVVIALDVPDRLSRAGIRDDLTAAQLSLPRAIERLQYIEPAKARDLERLEKEALAAFRRRSSVLMISPDASTCVPPLALRAVDYRLTLAPIDLSDVASVILDTTGAPIFEEDQSRLDGLPISPADLAVAVRPNRTPSQCVDHLVRLATRPPATGRGRDLTLDDVHGARDAVAWARSTLLDLAAWRQGAPWSSVSSGALLAGPPGTGKTLLASAMAATGDMPIISASLMQWQSQDQAHLGTTLKAMRLCFEEAKALAAGGRGCILLVDEIDAFPDRTRIRHDHADYVIEVVNALLEQLDGAAGREGVIVIGTTNDPTRVDPAIRRPGRLGKTITIGYPDADERVAMLRVRLGDDLAGADLLPVAYRTERATGAVIEHLVEDARRRARHAGRPLELADLLAAAGAGEHEPDEGDQYRAAIHEAGHALVASLSDPLRPLVVALQSQGGIGGWVQLTGPDHAIWTRDRVEARIRTLLAGRAAEELLLDSPSSGARHDLMIATRMCVTLLGEWGLGDRGLIAIEADPAIALTTDPGLRREVQELLARLYSETCDVVRARRDAIRRIADALLAERRLDQDRVATLIEKPAPRRGAVTRH